MPNQQWVGDISYIATDEGRLRLAVEAAPPNAELVAMKLSDDWRNTAIK